ncbi:MAG: hypothetical protein U0931_13965 [Vulcanimicrobiota bacterium]
MEIGALNSVTRTRRKRPRRVVTEGPVDTVQFLQTRQPLAAFTPSPAPASTMSGQLLRWMKTELAQTDVQSPGTYRKEELALLVNSLETIHGRNQQRRWNELARA